MHGNERKELSTADCGFSPLVTTNSYRVCGFSIKILAIFTEWTNTIKPTPVASGVGLSALLADMLRNPTYEADYIVYHS